MIILIIITANHNNITIVNICITQKHDFTENAFCIWKKIQIWGFFLLLTSKKYLNTSPLIPIIYISMFWDIFATCIKQMLF